MFGYVLPMTDFSETPEVYLSWCDDGITLICERPECMVPAGKRMVWLQEVLPVKLSPEDALRLRNEHVRTHEDHVPADEGHTFEITWRLRGSSKVTGDAHHNDSDYWSDPIQTIVRAWDLRSALHQAAELPFSVLMGEPDE